MTHPQAILEYEFFLSDKYCQSCIKKISRLFHALKWQWMAAEILKLKKCLYAS